MDEINHGAGLCAFGSVGKQPVFAANDKRLDAPFGLIVGDFQPATQEIALEMFSLRPRVMRHLPAGPVDLIVGVLTLMVLRRDIFAPQVQNSGFTLKLILFKPYMGLISL